MSGFKLNLSDLQFVLHQIKVAEANAAGIPLTSIVLDAAGVVVSSTTATVGGVPYYVADATAGWIPNPALGAPILAIPDPHVPVGLRTVDGTNNNIVPGRETWGAADQSMPRLFDPNYTTGTGTFDTNGPGPNGGLVTGGDYAVGGTIVDTAPRTVSNLIVDVTLNNPAAIIAALTFAGSTNVLADQGQITTAWDALKAAQDANAPTVAALQTALDTLLDAKGVTVINGSLDIPNVAADEGLTAPFNAWMTFFGQFFDHGLDLISKGSNGTIYVPLAADDPLMTHGVDGIAGNADDLVNHPELAFMALTRAKPTADGSQTNTTTPFVDQNQTYTSHASHQVFLREYVRVDGATVATGKLLVGTDGGLATWADVKAQAKEMLGITLTDQDVLNVPLLRTDAYGEFIRGANGFAQVIVGLGADGIPNTADDVVASGTNVAPLNLAALNGGLGPVRTSHAFLDDIAHNAAPVLINGVLAPDADGDTGNAVAINPQTGQRLAYDDELLDRHYITGDGRGNENIGLTTVHHIFHSEHNRQVDQQKVIILLGGDITFVNEWFTTDITATQLDTFVTGYNAATNKADFLANAGSTVFDSTGWDGERLFQAARFATEMQYQHLVFEEFARKIQPAVDAFVFNAVTDINPAIFSEFANTVYRFGHSMLTENMPRIDGAGHLMDNDLGLVVSFLNPVLFDNDGAITHDQGAAAIVRGMTIERGSEIDEFVVDALRNNLLGLPLDLAALNIARGRDTGMPSLNDARTQLYAASGSTFLKPYSSWADLASNLKNPASIVNFIAAYGTHASIVAATTLDDKRDAAMELVFGTDLNGGGVPADRLAFLNSTGPWTAANSGLNSIDLWIGGLAEKKMPFGGMLGSTFNAIFELQLENLQDADRFYYLSRTQGQNFLTMLEQNSFAKMIMANTDLAQPGADGIRGTADDIIDRHIGVDSFANYDYVLEVNSANQADYNGSAGGVDPAGIDPFLGAMGASKVMRDDPGTAATDLNFLRFVGGEHVVVGGTNGNDTIITDFGDDGIWGDAGDDRIESGAGVDLVNGGAGNDIITDSGDTGDFLKGDEGDDVIANSNGVDILMGGTGKDVVFVGVDATEVFGGEGDDFIAGGDGTDFLLGGEGNDWMEAAGGFDTTAGDNSELFFNSAIKGHDVMFAGSDEHDFDAESGDDIMVQGESVIRNEGMFGFDWAIYKGVNIAANADLRVPIFTTEQADILRNRFDKTEALSGWDKNDTLRGDDRVADAPGGPAITAANEGVFFNDELTQAGVDRIEGFRAMLGRLVTTAPANATATELEALVAFNSGNILLGGGGSDLLQGNGGDDFIDGDNWLNVRIRITGSGQTNVSGNQLATIDSLRHVFTAADGVPAWVGKSLFELMLNRTIVPDQLHIVREIVADDGVGDTDIAVFNDVRDNYTITPNADGTITVTQNTLTAGVIDPVTGKAVVSDGTDTVRNVEILRFSDQDIILNPPRLQLNGFDLATRNWADNFNAGSGYTGNNGTNATTFNAGWVETGDGTASAAAGAVQASTGALTFSAGNANNAAVSRALDLSPAVSATVTFTITDVNVSNDNNNDNEQILFEFAANGTNFVTIATFDGDNSGQQSFTLPTNVAFSPTAAIRFRAVNTLNAGQDPESFTIDNLSITASVPVPATLPSVNHQFTYQEQAAAQSIASLPDITDDGTTIAFARVVLTNPQAGDALTATGLAGTGINATTTTVAGQLVLTLTGSASHAAYERAIQGVIFSNTSDNPAAVARVIQVTVNDGILTSNVATTTVTLVPVDDPVNAIDDAIITNAAPGTAIVVPEWALLANDIDPDNTLDVTAVSAGNGVTTALNIGSITVTDTGAPDGTFTYAATGGPASDNATVTLDTVQTVTTFSETFGTTNYTQADGAWTQPWVESGDDSSSTAAAGQIRINTNRLEFDGAGDGAVIQRALTPPAGATSATISYNFGETIDVGETVLVQFSRDGTNLQTVQTITSQSGNNQGTGAVTDLVLTGPFNANAFVRFTVSTMNGDTDVAFIDNLDIEFATPATVVTGTAASQILIGDANSSTFNSAAGSDVVLAGAGNDTIVQDAADNGTDVIDGGTEATAAGDRYVLNGTNAAEVFRVYAKADAVAAGIYSAAGQAEIVVTRNTNGVAGAVTAANVIAELIDIEEITINTGAGTDTVLAIGNFNSTSLNFNTITINGGTGDDTVDFSALSSAHRIVFRSNGGNDTIVGTIRPQDVVELANGQDISTYALTDNGNGTKTLSNGTHSVTFAGTVPPQFETAQTGGNGGGNDDGPAPALSYTAADLAGLKALVSGLQPANGEDDVPTGVRTLSGHGNNLAHPTWGAADEPFTRITTAHYGEPDADGNRAINPVFEGLDPRVISDLIGTQEAGLPHAGNGANIFFMAMGQYLDHGLDFIGKGGNGTIQIGAAGGGAPGSGNPADLTRATVEGMDANGVPYHNNHTSPFVDQNQAYGSNTLVGTFLREGDGHGGVGAHLFAGAADPSNPAFKLLPTLRELIEHHWANNTVFIDDAGNQTSFQDAFPGLVTNGVIDATQLSGMISNFMGSGHALLLDTNPYINVLDHYVAGDGRANENIALTSIHTVWARNHNLHVAELEAAGFQGTAEELFQAAKIINEVEYQRVIFQEYAQTLLGGLRGDGDHGFDGYDPTVNPGISHEFAAAVFRFGHSLIGQTMTVLDANGNPQQVNLFDAFLNPTNDAGAFTAPLSQLAQFGYVPQPGYEQAGVGNILGGIVNQPAEDVDVNLVDAIRNDLVRINADLFAINQSRGWDLGLGTLNQVRRDLMNSTDPHVQESVSYAGDLSPYTSWADFQTRNGLSDAVIAQFIAAFPDLVLDAADIAAFRNVNPDIEIALQSNGTGVVKGIDRVDLWLGGLAEKHINGGIVGQTYWVVLQDQFDRLQDGDRFYYLDRVGDFDFYEGFVKEQTFADIVARNTGLTGLPEDIFSTPVVGGGDQAGGDDQGDTGEDTGGPVGGDDGQDDGQDNGEDTNPDTDEDDDVDQDDDDLDDEDDDADDGDDVETDDDGPVVVPPASHSIVGTAGDDVLIGTSNGDLIFGMAGSDAIIAGGAADIIKTGAGEDFIDAGDGRDVIFAGADADEVFAGGDDDLVYGDDGDDRIFAGDGNDMVTAGKGNDTVFGDAGNDTFVAEVGDGDDVYHGDGQNGGTGIDTLDMSATTVAVTVNLGTGLMNHGSAVSSQTGNDTLWGIENAVTGSGADTIIASNAVNVMDGGAGADIFRFHTTETADGDTIVGFEPGDRLDFTNIDANLGVAGDQAFQLVNGNSSNAAAQLVVLHESRPDGDYTVVEGHVNGDGTADFQVNIKGHHTLTSGDFSL